MTLIEQIIETDDILHLEKRSTSVTSKSENSDDAGNAEVMKSCGQTSILDWYSSPETIHYVDSIKLDKNSLLEIQMSNRRTEINGRFQNVDPGDKCPGKSREVEIIESSERENHQEQGEIDGRNESLAFIKQHNLNFLRNRNPLGFVAKIPIGISNRLLGLSFAFAGNAEPLDRTEATALIKSCDGVIVPLIPTVRQVSLVIVGRNPVRKTLQMITERGIKMIDQEILFWMIERSPFAKL